MKKYISLYVPAVNEQFLFVLDDLCAVEKKLLKNTDRCGYTLFIKGAMGLEINNIDHAELFERLENWFTSEKIFDENWCSLEIKEISANNEIQLHIRSNLITLIKYDGDHGGGWLSLITQTNHDFNYCNVEKESYEKFLEDWKCKSAAGYSYTHHSIFTKPNSETIAES